MDYLGRIQLFFLPYHKLLILTDDFKLFSKGQQGCFFFSKKKKDRYLKLSTSNLIVG